MKMYALSFVILAFGACKNSSSSSSAKDANADSRCETALDLPEELSAGQCAHQIGSDTGDDNYVFEKEPECNGLGDSFRYRKLADGRLTDAYPVDCNNANITGDGGFVQLQKDGNVVIYGAGNLIASSHTDGHSPVFTKLKLDQTEGVLYLYDANGGSKTLVNFTAAPKK